MDANYLNCDWLSSSVQASCVLDAAGVCFDGELVVFAYQHPVNPDSKHPCSKKCYNIAVLDVASNTYVHLIHCVPSIKRICVAWKSMILVVATVDGFMSWYLPRVIGEQARSLCSWPYPKEMSVNVRKSRIEMFVSDTGRFLIVSKQYVGHIASSGQLASFHMPKVQSCGYSHESNNVYNLKPGVSNLVHVHENVYAVLANYEHVRFVRFTETSEKFSEYIVSVTTDASVNGMLCSAVVCPSRSTATRMDSMLLTFRDRVMELVFSYDRSSDMYSFVTMLLSADDTTKRDCKFSFIMPGGQRAVCTNEGRLLSHEKCSLFETKGVRAVVACAKRVLVLSCVDAVCQFSMFRV